MGFQHNFITCTVTKSSMHLIKYVVHNYNISIVSVVLSNLMYLWLYSSMYNYKFDKIMPNNDATYVQLK